MRERPLGTGSCRFVITTSGLLAAAILLLASCKAKQPVAPVEVPANTPVTAPAWVSARPVSSADYIGIGVAPKSRPDYQEAAKKNALNDLASEISVTVEGNSLLYTLDRKYKFDEEFTSTISTRTKEHLEGYRLVDSYEGPTDYWIYYRLDKAEYARIKAERKQKALAQAADLYGRAAAGLGSGDLRGAFDADLRALMAIREYWGENDQVEVDGRSVPLANELFSHLQAMASGVRLSVLPERCALNWSNRFKRELLITATYAATGRALPQLPVTISYPGHDGPVKESRNTDADGRVRTLVQRADLDARSAAVLVKLDVADLAGKDLDPTFVAPLLGSLTVPEAHVPIDPVMPKVLFRGTERNLGQPLADAPLAIALKEAMTAKGFRIVGGAADADLVVELNAETRQVGESNGFFTVALDETVKVTDRRTGEVIHEGGKQGLKGIQLDYAKAGMDAYKKAAVEMRSGLFPAMMNTLFQ